MTMVRKDCEITGRNLVNAEGLSRRKLLAAAALAGLAPLGTRSAFAQAAGVLKGVNINHVNLEVSDLAASSAFVQRVFGMGAVHTILQPGGDAYSVEFGGVMLTLHLNLKAGISNHFDIGILGFQPKRDGDALKAAGFPARGQSDEWVSIADPDGVGIQISDTRFTAVCDYCEKPKVPAYVKREPLLQARAFKYVNLKVTDIAKTVAFYRNVFGLPPERPLRGRPGKAVALDIGSSFLLLDEEPGAAVRINHFCIGVDKLLPKKDAARIKAAGIAVEQAGEVLTVTGPDNAKIAIADISWTG